MTVRDDYSTTPPGGGRLTTKFYSVDAHEHAAAINAAAVDAAVVHLTGAETLSGKSIDGTTNTLTSITGHLLPVVAGTTTETVTIVSGSVTQIAGTTVDGVTIAVGDRILVHNAPASTGAGTAYSYTNNPNNGIYVAAAVGANITVSRAPDMTAGAGSIAGMIVFVARGSSYNAISYYVQNPNTTATVVYGTTNIGFAKYLDGLTVTTVATQTLTSKTLTSPILTTPVLGTPASGNLANCTFPTLNQNTSGTAAVATKWVPRVGTTTSSATPSIDASLYEQYNITALGAAITSVTVTNPAEGLKLTIRIKDNGTARAIALGASFRALGVTLPTTTVLSKTLYLGCIYNGAGTVWDVVAVAQEA